MDVIRSEETRYNIHKRATEAMRSGDYAAAEKIYRDALLLYPNKPGMIIGLANVLALKREIEEAVELMERGLRISENEKMKATTRAVLCFLYLKLGNIKKANWSAQTLPHIGECREVIAPLIERGLDDDEIDENIKKILLGLDD